jgi:hypothetical protein
MRLKVFCFCLLLVPLLALGAVFELKVSGTATAAAPFVWTNTVKRLVLSQAVVTAVTPGDITTVITVTDGDNVYALPAFSSTAFTNGYISPSFAAVPNGAVVRVETSAAAGVKTALFLSE